MIVFEDPVVEANTATVGIDTEGEVGKFFSGESFVLTCELNLEGCPDSILQIPAIVNAAPVAWAQDAAMKTSAPLEETFHASLENLKQGYAELYPDVFDDGPVRLEAAEEPVEERAGTRPSILFSGGVDSTAAAVDRLEEDPALITVRGSDIAPEDEDAWDGIRSTASAFAGAYNLELQLVHSNFRNVLNNRFLHAEYNHRLGRDWWGAVQYGTVLPALAAPIAYERNYGSVHLASGFTGDPTFATAQPSYVNRLAWAGSEVSVADVGITRQEKVQRVTKQTVGESAAPIRSCLHSPTGANCSGCEKCYRTMVGLVLAGANPNDSGYDWSPAKAQQIGQAFGKGEITLGRGAMEFWRELAAEYRNRPASRDDDPLAWLEDLEPQEHTAASKQPAAYRMTLTALRHAPYPLDTQIDGLVDRVTGRS